MPSYVQDSIPMTGQRILLIGPAGPAWYLGERVAMQSLNTKQPFIPSLPPASMMDDYWLQPEDRIQAVEGIPAKDLLHSGDYAAYRDDYIRFKKYPAVRHTVKALHIF